MEGHKFVKISTDELLNGTCVIVELDEKTDKICVCRDVRELIVFPIIDEGEK